MYLYYSKLRADIYDNLWYSAVYVLVLFMGFVLTSFSKFHLRLVLGNMTTIENLDRERLEGSFDMGCAINWRQVFGSNLWLWLVPYYGRSGKPSGDGVKWPLPAVVQEMSNRNSEKTDRIHSPPRPSESITPPKTPDGPLNISALGRPSEIDTDTSYLMQQALLNNSGSFIKS